MREYPDLKEEYILSLLRSGNEKGLSMIFQWQQAGLIYFAMKFVKDRPIAEDLVSEAFVKLWDRRDDFPSLPAIRSFLFTTVKNAGLNHIRQRQRHGLAHKEIEYLAEKTQEFFEEEMLKAEILQRIWDGIERLPPARRQIFKMFYTDGYSTFEIAKILQLSVDTVRVQKARAIHALRAYILQRDGS